MKKLILLIFVSILLTASAASAATYYVLANATGNGSGSDWTNAYTSMPNTVTAGDTYYVAAGTYNITNASITVITVTMPGPNAVSHGTATGWNAAYVGKYLMPVECVGAACNPAPTP